MAINLDRFNIEAQRTDKALGFSSMEEIHKAANSGFITVKALMQSTKPHPINLDCFSEDEIVAMWFVLFGATQVATCLTSKRVELLMCLGSLKQH